MSALSALACAHLRAAGMLDAADLAEEQAWAHALECPPRESNAIARLVAIARVETLCTHAESLRILAAGLLEVPNG